ncbi:hypothetical protein WJX79_002381 [Trebouxia sp. C0005]
MSYSSVVEACASKIGHCMFRVKERQQSCPGTAAQVAMTLDASSCRGFYNIGCKPFHTSVLNYVQPLLHTGLTHCMHPVHTGLSY